MDRGCAVRQPDKRMLGPYRFELPALHESVRREVRGLDLLDRRDLDLPTYLYLPLISPEPGFMVEDNNTPSTGDEMTSSFFRSIDQ